MKAREQDGSNEHSLARLPVLARLGAVGAAHHERLDGSGYHRGLAGPGLTTVSRIVAAADAYHAMIEPRAHRAALTPAAAAAELRREAGAGLFDAATVDAVLVAAGHPRRKRRSGPGGLTPREVEVLVLLARGATNRQVADELGITAKTAGTHVERISTKIGASNRATATLFAVDHGLLEPLADPGAA